MTYLKFKKEELANLEYSLKREVLSTSKTGAFATSTIVSCNTRKYHGLLIVPIEEQCGERFVLLSSLDETVIQHGQEFNLGIHKYPGNYEPRGHKYMYDFQDDTIPTQYYRVGGVQLKKETIMSDNKNQIFIRYTLLDAHSQTTLRVKPFLAYRNIHTLSKANMFVNTHYESIEKGIRSRMYEGLPAINMQLNKENEFVGCPDWYYKIEYREEQNRGYDFQEDLFVPGYFEIELKKGESVIFSASTEETNPSRFNATMNKVIKDTAPKDSFVNCLKFSADQFITKQGKGTEIVAGYPWFGAWGRDTFIALPGITLYANGGVAECKKVLDTMTKTLNNGLFPNVGKDENAAFNSVDAPIFFFTALQEYNKFVENNIVWKQYGAKIKSILSSYRDGINEFIGMRDNFLIWAKQPGRALTWMDAVVNGEPVTQRGGYQVEINALWYNAICYTLSLAEEMNDTKFIDQWSEYPEKIKQSFLATFWNESEAYLADYVDEEGQNLFIRPNMIYACSLKYSMLNNEQIKSVIKHITHKLLTPKGLRTLAPRNTLYKGFYEGNQEKRDSAYHQGTVWPWLLGPYVEACFRMYGKNFYPKAQEILNGFEENMSLYGIGSIAEIYDGNPPFNPNGTISQAWSVGELLRIVNMCNLYKKGVSL